MEMERYESEGMLTDSKHTEKIQSGKIRRIMFYVLLVVCAYIVISYCFYRLCYLLYDKTTFLY